jgi:type II secretory ATPase GspE/PulE/Tfp pilus assembly ATPase PilB-like protein
MNDDRREVIAPSPLDGLEPGHPRYAIEAVDRLLTAARHVGASDLHLDPTPEGLSVRWRLDGVLQNAATVPLSVAPNVVSRIKVLADLLTYRNDVPQEGRIRTEPGGPETRVSTMPTLHGERAVIRLFAPGDRYRRIDDLGLPDSVADALTEHLDATGGLVVLAGPAGSGKTTTLYACFRELAARSQGRRSLVTLEDPIEVAVPGVSQSQVNPAGGFTLETGLRSLLRQDPEVIGVGEVRDRAVAEVAFQATLSGHLVLTTFHAGSAAGAIGRLADMGIEPYVLASGLRSVVFQRLARRLCSCARDANPDDGPAATLGLDVARSRIAVGCPSCVGTGYRGRMLIAEAIHEPGRGALGRAILDRRDIDALETAARADGLHSRWLHARRAVEEGQTSAAEIRRVLGTGPDPES